jgi:hypothetical protein
LIGQEVNAKQVRQCTLLGGDLEPVRNGFSTTELDCSSRAERTINEEEKVALTTPFTRCLSNRSIIAIALDLFLVLISLGFDLDLATALPEFVFPLAAPPTGATAIRAFDLFLVFIDFGFDLYLAWPVPVLVLPLATLASASPVIR